MADGLFYMERYCDEDDAKLDICEKVQNASFKRNSPCKKEKDEADDFLKISQKRKKLKRSNKSHPTSKNQECVGDTFNVTHEKGRKVSPKSLAERENMNENVDPSNSGTGGLEKGAETFAVIGQIKKRPNDRIKPALPKWLRNPTTISINLEQSKVLVAELPVLDDCLKKNLADSGIEFLFPVQQTVIPWLMQNSRSSLFIRPSDLCVSAPTGSGKTLAFVVPIVQSLRDRTVSAIRAVVVLPVSELAMQVYKIFDAIVKNTDLKVVLITGQKSFSAEQNALVKKGLHSIVNLADIVVTTPGRILDHIHRTEGFSLQHLRYLVIDEADRMMDDIQRGWLMQIEEAVYREHVVSQCACFSVCGGRIQSMHSNACSFGYINHSFQKLLYSATLSHDPEKLHSLSLYKPKLFITKEKLNSEEWISKCPLPEELVLKQIVCDAKLKPLILCHFIKTFGFKKILCFTETIERTQRLQLILKEMGLVRSKEISSNYRPVQRKIIMKQFSSGKIDVIVCSDLVARGIDIEGVDCVISYDVPPFVKTYIHRVGRTARAGKSGTAVALICKNELPNFKKMLADASIPLPTELKVNETDLSGYVEKFQKALKTADAQFSKLKNNVNNRNSSKKRKKEKIINV